jgi:hypothetical protein
VCERVCVCVSVRTPLIQKDQGEVGCDVESVAQGSSQGKGGGMRPDGKEGAEKSAIRSVVPHLPPRHRQGSARGLGGLMGKHCLTGNLWEEYW